MPLLIIKWDNFNLIDFFFLKSILPAYFFLIIDLQIDFEEFYP